MVVTALGSSARADFFRAVAHLDFWGRGLSTVVEKIFEDLIFYREADTALIDSWSSCLSCISMSAGIFLIYEIHSIYQNEYIEALQFVIVLTRRKCFR